MKPIPEDARANDPIWEVEFLKLAQGFVSAGAKAKVISRFTDFPLGKIRRMYRSLRGSNPPAGPVVQGTPRFFAIPGKHTSTTWSIQTAIFLACYERLGKITDTPVQRGWRLLAAFTVYLSLTEKLYRTASVKRLDINQAYALLSHCGFMAQEGGVALRLKECRSCLISYPVVTTQSLDDQRCPVCAINAKSLRLSAQASQPGPRKSRAKPKKQSISRPSPPVSGGE